MHGGCRRMQYAHVLQKLVWDLKSSVSMSCLDIKRYP